MLEHMQQNKHRAAMPPPITAHQSHRRCRNFPSLKRFELPLFEGFRFDCVVAAVAITLEEFTVPAGRFWK
jgi:hypothetical protein